ncbi:MAG: hypothetical protein D6798_14785, partial [Deltaproteobacteria bacterium]
MLFGLALSCAEPGRPDGSVDDWTRCEDAACRAQLLPEAWRRDPEGVTRTILGLDPLAQEAAVRTLAAHEGPALQQLCPELHGAVGDTCHKLLQRPHLAMEVPPSAATVEIPTRPAPGPSGAHLPRPPTAGLADIHSEALRAALDACGAQSSSGTERDECIFQAAERHVQDGGMAHFAEGMAACAMAGRFVMPCAQHLLSLATPPASPADAPTAPSIAALAAAEEQLAAAVGPELAPLYV